MRIYLLDYKEVYDKWSHASTEGYYRTIDAAKKGVEHWMGDDYDPACWQTACQFLDPTGEFTLTIKEVELIG